MAESREEFKEIETKEVSDPNRFFLHTKHILNRVDEAIFAQPVLCRPNPGNYGSLYHFPPIAQPARLAGGAAPGAGDEKKGTSQVVALLLEKARKKPTIPPLCEPSPPCQALASTPDPRLLLMGHNTYFRETRKFLTLREYTTLSRLNHAMRKLTLETTSYWQERFKKLCLGPHIYVPIFSNSILRRWVKVLYLQQALAHHKRQLDLDLVTAAQLEEPFKQESTDALTNQFRSRTHQCGLCHLDVPYALHLDNNHKKVVDIVQMACPSCDITKLWSRKEATVLWGIPPELLKDLACWRLPTKLAYTTEDLLEAWHQMDLKGKTPSQVIPQEIALRHKDLPLEVQQFVKVHESKDGTLPAGLKDEKEMKRAQGSIWWVSYAKTKIITDAQQFSFAPQITLLPPTKVREAKEGKGDAKDEKNVRQSPKSERATVYSIPETNPATLFSLLPPAEEQSAPTAPTLQP